ncbi:MAG: hypothetical protein M3083_06900 [Actinomycetota bacterium]|nr:hypothetical protein [Actinomycetota bacterium]MDQ6948870.1 hypothetical protein [Actinomycetota bacterium]
MALAPALVDHGAVNLVFSQGQPDRAQVRAVAGHAAVPLAQLVILPTEARRLNLALSDVAIYVTGADRQPARRMRAANYDLARLGIGELTTEKGYQNHIGTGLLAVAIGDLVLAFGAALAATALMSVDGKDDLMTLAAVGAAPNGRRRLTMARAGVLCLVGALFGTLAGVIPGLGLVWRIRHLSAGQYFGAFGTYSSSRYPLTIPWLGLAAVVVAAPLLAALTAAVVTRARLPVERRGAW